MNIDEAISFGEDRIGLFGGKMDDFIKMSVETMKDKRDIDLEWKEFQHKVKEWRNQNVRY